MPCIYAKERSAIHLVGDYSNIITSIDDDPHQSGYAVVLYQLSDGTYFGDFTYAMGSTEAVGSPLIDLKVLDRRISFTARTSSAAEMDGSPSRELFKFSGVIQDRSIRGVLSKSDGKGKSTKIYTEKIRLIRRPLDLMEPKNYEDYLRFAPQAAW